MSTARTSSPAGVRPRRRRALTVRAETAATVLMLQGVPIGEPVAARGPFVMNTEREILEAYDDYRRTGFGGWPWRTTRLCTTGTPAASPATRRAGRTPGSGTRRIAGALPVRAVRSATVSSSKGSARGRPHLRRRVLVPNRTDVASRFDVNLATSDGSGTTIPIVVANMTAVAGRRMAETVAGAAGSSSSRRTFRRPRSPKPSSRQEPAPGRGHPDHPRPRGRRLRRTDPAAKRAHRAAVVVDGGKPIGVLTESSCADVDRFTRARGGGGTSRPPRVTATPREVFGLLESRHDHSRDRRDDGMLAGVLTRTVRSGPASTPPPSTSGAAADRGGRRGQRGRGREGEGPCRRRRRLLARHRARPPATNARRPACVAALGLGVPLVAATWSRRAAPGL